MNLVRIQLPDRSFETLVLAVCRSQDAAAAMVPENRNQRGPYFTAFSLRIPDMPSFINLREIVKICTRSRRV